LPLCLEAGNDLPRVHPRFDNLQGYAAPYGRLLLGHEDHAKAPLADLLKQLVWADLTAGTFRERPFASRVRRRRRAFKEASRVGLGGEHPLNSATEAVVDRTSVV
jgi:hypothetical protein